MELSSKLLDQSVFNTRPKIEEHMLFVMNKNTHEERLSIPLQTNNKQFEIAVTFLPGYNGIFDVTNKNNYVFLTKSNNDGDFSVISIPLGAYEIKSLNMEIKRNIFEEGCFTRANYPFTIKPKFSALGSFIEISPIFTCSQIAFTPDDGISDLLGFKRKVIHEEDNLSDYLDNILSFDNVFLVTDVAQGMIFKGKRSDINQNFAMDVDTGCKYLEKFRGGLTWYKMESKDFVSIISFRLKREEEKLVSFNGQSITIR